MKLADGDFIRLLELRRGLRRFMHWSEERAQAAGVTPAQHQLLLSVRGHEDPAGPTIGEVADSLMLRHHSAVGLVDRAAAAGLVERHHDPVKHSVVRISLTRAGEAKLEALSEAHLEELRRLAPMMRSLWQSLDHDPSVVTR